jgi:Flp pilus assembly protein CpaB
MSGRRGRALVFLLAALVCAGLAATVAGRYRSGVDARYGPLRPVVVARAELSPGKAMGPAEVHRELEVRRVPTSFVPHGALQAAVDALGRTPAATIPAGSYVLAAQLVVPQPQARPAGPAGVGPGLRPVQVPVTGGEALTIGDGSPEGSRVDVVVSEQSGLGRRGRTFVAVEAVRLLALDGPGGPGEGWSATLALTRSQALELIAAETAAREIRLLPRP